MKTINAHELYKRMQAPEGTWPHRQWALFDVREPGESQNGHIPSATFLPRRMLEYRLPELLSTKATPVILYDSGQADDSRAKLAAQSMDDFGYTDVTGLDRGAAAWQSAGHELATGWNVPGKDFGERQLAVSNVPYLSPDELADRLAQGEKIGIFDVRTPGEYRESSIPGSISAPSFEWASHIKDIADTYDTIIIHCAGRTRSIIGAATACALGIDNIHSLENGTMGWILADRELAKGQDGILGTPSDKSRRYAQQRSRQLADESGAAYIAADTLRNWSNDRSHTPVYIFDTRDMDAYTAGHIPGAISLPGGQACQRADDFAAVPGSRIVFVDDDDARAALSAYWYCRMGFPNVSVLDQGMPGWLQMQYPIETGRGRSALLGLESAERATQAYDAVAFAKVLDLEKPPLVIDVGTSEQFAACHIRGAIWIPRGSLEDKINDYANTSTPLVLTARDPNQSTFAAASLVAKGFTDVRRLLVPGKDWHQSLSTETGLPEGMASTQDTLAIPYLQNKARMREYLEWEEKLGQKHKSESSTSGARVP
ncbi:rhodanese-like domain-containing protein [Sneathiella sp.]|uniref:rhodanese-like domain-containing protein n=1 Tax=Sneathiella sp. TaxID=1964365 RepID=UPI00356B5052